MVLLTILFISAPAFATPRKLINFQGRLLNAGTPVTGLQNLTFRICNAPTGAPSIMWEETQTGISLDSEGIFSATLGINTPLDTIDFSVPELWVEVVYGGQAFSPRQRLTGAAFASYAITAETVGTVLTTSGNKVTVAGTIESKSGGFMFPNGTIQTTAVSSTSAGGWKDSGITVELSTITDRVGIGTSSPSSRLTVAGTIESTSGGLKFPDQSIQTTAVTSTSAGGWVKGTGKVTLATITDNVGIGTTEPTQKLEVSSASEPLIKITNTLMSGSPSLMMGMNNGNNAAFFQATNGKDFKFYNGQYALTILGSNGYVGIGTVSPTQRLQIAGNINFEGTNPTIYGLSGGVGVGNVNTGWYSDATNVAARLPVSTGDFYVQGPGDTPNYLMVGGSAINPSIPGLRLYTGNAVFDGNVGIGTVSPAAPLTISKSDGAELLRISATLAPASFYLKIKGENGTGGTADYRFQTVNNGIPSDSLYLKGNGNVGIGTTTPGVTLEVNGIIKASNLANIRAGFKTVVLTSTNFGSVTFDTPFPNDCIAVVACNGDPDSSGSEKIISIRRKEYPGYDKNGFNFFVYPAPGNVSFRVNYIAYGY
jgi:hypothetical protein